VALQLQALPNLILTHHWKLTSLERNPATPGISFMPQFQEGPSTNQETKTTIEWDNSAAH